MDDFEFWRLYKAITFHFTNPSYNYYKYSGRTNLNEDSFAKVKDKYAFVKLAKKFQNEDDAIGYIVSNLIEDNKIYIRAFKQENYIKWQKYKDGLYYHFAEDFKKNKWILLSNRIIEHIENTYGQSRFPFEFFLIINEILDNSLLTKLNKDYSDNMLWCDIGKKLELLRPFLIDNWKINREKLVELKKIVKDNI